MVLAAAQTPLQESLVPSREEGPLVSAGGSDWASQPLPLSAVGLAAGGPDPLLSDFIEPLRNTILNAKALSTLLQYKNRWEVFF